METNQSSTMRREFEKHAKHFILDRTTSEGIMRGDYYMSVTQKAWMAFQAGYAAAKAEGGWMPIESLPKDGALYRIHYGYGQQEAVKWSKKIKLWTNFEGDPIYEGIGNATHWQEYNQPPHSQAMKEKL